MASLAVTYCDLEGHFCCGNPFLSHIGMISGTTKARVVRQRVLSTVCLDIIGKVHMACNFNYLFKNEGLLEVTASYTVNVVISWKRFQIES